MIALLWAGWFGPFVVVAAVLAGLLVAHIAELCRRPRTTRRSSTDRIARIALGGTVRFDDRTVDYFEKRAR